MRRANLGEPSRFAAKAYTSMTDLEPLIGADVGAMVREELPDATYATLFAYCYRRFGPPNRGSDDYKEIARWMVATPMDGVVLSISVTASAVWTSFDGYVERDLFDGMMKARNAHGKEFRRRFATWHRKVHGDHPPGWNDTTSQYMAMTQEQREARSAALTARWREYDETVPLEKREPRLPEPLAGAHAAIRRTLRDLTRAVGVRDSEIDASGVVDRHDAPTARPYKYAGHWYPHFMMGPDIYPFHDAVERLGGGAKGLRRLNRIIEKAVPPQAPRGDLATQEQDA